MKILVGISLLTLVVNLLLLRYLVNSGQQAKTIKGSGKVSFTLTPQEEVLLEEETEILETEALPPNKN